MKIADFRLALAISALALPAAQAEQAPILSEEDAVLHIPYVSTESQPGVFQDISLHPAGDDTWRLGDVVEGVLLDVIEDVEVIVTDSSPTQVFLRLHGTFPSGCGAIGHIVPRQSDSHFDVNIFYANDEWLANPEEIACTLALRPFTHTVALPVYGLSAGDYDYSVNGKFTGSFTLTTDNTLE